MGTKYLYNNNNLHFFINLHFLDTVLIKERSLPVLPSLAVMRYLPLGLKSKDKTCPLCPFKLQASHGWVKWTLCDLLTGFWDFPFLPAFSAFSFFFVDVSSADSFSSEILFHDFVYFTLNLWNMPRSYMKNLHKNNARSQPEWEWSITLNMSYYMYFILVI